MPNGQEELLVSEQRQFFRSGQTRSNLFRLKQLRELKQMVKNHENEVLEALYQDLNKSATEAYSAEIALVYDEINRAIGHLRQWTRDVRVKTPISLEPSSSWMTPEPKGIVLIIGPWNYPFQLVMLPLVGAMAAGNCAVVKPSGKAPNTSALLAQLLENTFSPEYIALVQGLGAETVPRLMKQNRFDHIFFTGSTEVGRTLLSLAAPYLTPVTLELGGKSPAIVMEDARLDVAARRIVWGKFYNAGQTCIAPDYVLVHERARVELIRQMKQALLDFFGQSPQNSDSYGRIIDQQRFDVLTDYLSQGRILAGGDVDRENLYIAPTLMDRVSMETSLMQDEIFGPILPILTFREVEQAIDIVQRNPEPLAFYLFTESRKMERKWLEEVPFGGGVVNSCLLHAANPHLPFGGIGKSGMGRYHGKATFDLFTHFKGMMRSTTRLDPDLKYPPYTAKKLKIIRKLL